MTRLLRAWTERRRPHLGVIVLGYALFVAFTLPFWGLPEAGDPSGGTVSVVSWWPDALRRDPWLFASARLVLSVAAVLWALQRLLPWSAWATVGAFTLVHAMALESWSVVTHTFHLTNQLLVVHALWVHAYHRRMRVAREEGRFFASLVYPGWAAEASVACVALFHGYSAVSKWLTSGVAWANGTTMQLLVHRFAQGDVAWLTELLLEHRPLAQGFQVAALVVEGLAFFAVVPGRFRQAIGLSLVGFYVGILVLFGWPFHHNLVLTGVLLLWPSPSGAPPEPASPADPDASA